MASISYFFDDFRLDVQSRELWHGSQLIMLAPRVFGCLAYLIEHRDRAVGRDELISAVWERTNIAENLLVQAIARLRTTLGDNSEAPRFVRTVPRFGYRWVAATQQRPTRAPASAQSGGGAESPAPNPPPAKQEEERAELDREVRVESGESARDAALPSVGGANSSSVPARSALGGKFPGKRTLVFVVIAAVVIFVAAFALRGTVFKRVAAPGSATASSSTIVLPVAGEFEDEDAWIRLGIMDFVARRLSVDGVTVMPSESTLAVLGNDSAHSDSEAIQRVLPGHLGRVVQLNAQRAATGWRIEGRLADGKQPPSIFDAESDNIIDAARQISEKIAVALGGKPHPIDATRDAPSGKLELMQKVDAALLAEKMDVARELVAAASPALKQLPEIRFLLERVEYRSGHVKEADAILQPLLADTATSVDSPLRAEMLNAYAAIQMVKGDPASAREQYSAALTLARMGEDEDLIGKILVGRGAAQRDLGLFDDADKDFAEARNMLEKVGDKLLLARLDTHVAMADMNRGRPDYAAEAFERAIAAFGRYGASGSRMAVENQLFELRYYMLDHAVALTLSETLLHEASQAQNPYLTAGAHIDHSRALFSLGRLREATAELQALEADPQLASFGDFRPRVLAFAAQLAWEGGNGADALKKGREAWAGVFSEPERGRLGRTIAAASRDPADLEALRAWAKQGKTAIPKLYVALAEADAALARNDTAAADTAFRAADAAALESGMPAEEVEVAWSWMPTLIERKDLEQASLLAARVARWADTDFRSAQLQLQFHRASGNTTAETDALARVRKLAGERLVQ